MGASGIEFVVDEPTPDASPPPPPRRRWWVPVGALVLAVVAGGAWYVARPTPQPVPRASTQAPKPAQTALDAISPNTVVCRSRGPSAGLAAAIMRAFPTGHLDLQSGEQCADADAPGPDQQLLYQAVSTDIGPVTVDVEIATRTPTTGLPRSPRHNEPRPGRTMLAASQTESASVEVYVTAYGPPSARPPAQAMGRLADQLGLTSPGLEAMSSVLTIQVNSGGVKGHVIH